jgi:hypothetical protein
MRSLFLWGKSCPEKRCVNWVIARMPWNGRGKKILDESEIIGEYLA